MNGAWAKPAQAGEVLPGAVAFVFGQAVAGIDLIKLHHDTVAGYFSHDGGTGDREAESIAIDDARLGEGYLGQLDEIDEEILRGRVKLLYGRLHGQASGFSDALMIDNFTGGRPDADGEGNFTDTNRQFLADRGA